MIVMNVMIILTVMILIVMIIFMIVMMIVMTMMIKASRRVCKDLNLSVATSVIFKSVCSARAHSSP